MTVLASCSCSCLCYQAVQIYAGQTAVINAVRKDTLVLNCSLSPSSWAALPDNWLHSDQDQFMHKSYIEVEYVCAISTASWWCSHCPDCILSVNLCVLTVGRCPLLLCAYSEQNGSIGFAYRLGSESLCSWPVRWHRWRCSATNIFKIWRSSWRYA